MMMKLVLSKEMYNIWINVSETVLQQSYNPNEDYTDAEIELRARLATFLDSAKSFNVIYAKVQWNVDGYL